MIDMAARTAFWRSIHANAGNRSAFGTDISQRVGYKIQLIQLVQSIIPTKPIYQTMSTTLQGLNITPGSPSTISSTNSTITVQALPVTDLWRKPPSTNSTNAPAYIIYRPLQKFKRARVTISADWTRLYDQGGLVFYINSRGLDEENYGSWVKTGIEFFDERPNVGTVTTPVDGYSDWSLVPTGKKSATIEVVPEKGGPSMHVYLIEEEKRTLVREVAWVFQEKYDQLLGVGVYAARPTNVEGEESGKGEALSVNFEGLEIEWTE
ncbi:unnamed protein product [Rhizoctonia solani]|uniref:Uncharacterized protein n=1 Tax=Rhizoctonia solani TaxID=456999 RepID=A0A8H3GN21_9AGAM|nr:unnamed protein product [Rhizoctonia solani]